MDKMSFRTKKDPTVNQPAELTHLMQFCQSEGRQLGTNGAGGSGTDLSLVLCGAHLARLHMFLREDRIKVLVLITRVKTMIL